MRGCPSSSASSRHAPPVGSAVAKTAVANAASARARTAETKLDEAEEEEAEESDDGLKEMLLNEQEREAKALIWYEERVADFAFVPAAAGVAAASAVAPVLLLLQTH